MTKEIPFRTAYGPKKRVVLDNFEPTLTDQSFKKMSDIHNVLKQYDKTGLITHVNKHAPIYDDVSDLPAYQDAMNLIVSAQTAFDGLPVKVKKRFGYDPEEFISFMSDSENRDEAIKLGLVAPPPPPEPEPVVEEPTTTETTTTA